MVLSLVLKSELIIVFVYLLIPLISNIIYLQGGATYVEQKETSIH